MREIITKQTELNSTKVTDNELNFSYTKSEKVAEEGSANTAVKYSYKLNQPTARCIGIAYESTPAVGGCIAEMNVEQIQNTDLGTQLLFEDNNFRMSVNQLQGSTPDLVIFNETTIEIGSNKYIFNSDGKFTINNAELNLTDGLELNDSGFKISRCDSHFDVSNNEHSIHIANFIIQQNIYFSTSKQDDKLKGLFAQVINA